VQDTQKTEVVEYPLVYDGTQWKLKNELEAGSIEQILFSYALDQ
jgi:hypothetical protein